MQNLDLAWLNSVTNKIIKTDSFEFIGSGGACLLVKTCSAYSYTPKHYDWTHKMKKLHARVSHWGGCSEEFKQRLTPGSTSLTRADGVVWETPMGSSEHTHTHTHRPCVYDTKPVSGKGFTSLTQAGRWS